MQERRWNQGQITRSIGQNDSQFHREILEDQKSEIQTKREEILKKIGKLRNRVSNYFMEIYIKPLIFIAP